MRTRRLALALVLTATFAAVGAAQQPAPDSFVARFLSARGRAGDLGPVLEGCPHFQPWQEMDIAYLSSARLTPTQREVMVWIWGDVMKRCQEPRLERWVLAQLEDAIRSRASDSQLFWFDISLSGVNTPGLRQYFWNLMLDGSKPANARYFGGGEFFDRLKGGEATEAFLRAVQTRRMPPAFAMDQAMGLSRTDHGRLSRGMADLIRADPHLVEEPAFAQVATSIRQFGTPAERRVIGEALLAVVDAPGIPEAHRESWRLIAQRLISELP